MEKLFYLEVKGLLVSVDPPIQGLDDTVNLIRLAAKKKDNAELVISIVLQGQSTSTIKSIMDCVNKYHSSL